MSLTVILFTAVALSMDAFAVSITKGMTIKNLTKGLGIKIALFFGIFQGGMPLLGWVLGISFEKYIKSIDHWIVLILLSFLGFKMISEFIKARKEEDIEQGLEYSATHDNEELSNKELLMLSIATSIDALAIGISFAFLSVDIVSASICIAVITFLICIIGVLLGNKIGDIFSNYAELVGGIILIIIGIKIFNEHTQILGNIIHNIF
ncbi:manganese efflux pump MntP family protein [Romboutsia sp.]|uniref:manganese efflux pump MntP n=1 Tax=Romboutsia sp. TaxID=1965302 RepID=UPI002C7C8765|nr:manganese efflux pump MntP family protein [Romboutsia sp.]HSQ89283.1 manganese efflux pump MntP family protein [Romboutsia sp.]